MILQRYIFRELVITFAAAFAILVAVCSVGLIFNMFRSAEGITLSLIYYALPVAFSYMAPWALIVAATLSSTMVYGRLAAENEIDAMRTSGIHMGRIVAPALLYAVVVFVLGFFTQHELAPWARYERRGIIGETIINLLKNTPPGPTNIKVSGRHRLSYVDSKDREIIEPTLAIFGDTGDLAQQFRGSTGTIKIDGDRIVHITIRQGTFTKWERVDGRLVEVMIANIGEQTITVQLEDPYARGKSSEDMAGLELVSEWSRSGGEYRRVLYTELHLRFAKALGPICLILLAIPIGIRVKKGTKLSGLGMALPPLLIYFILFFVGQSLAQRRLLAPEAGAYGPNAVVLAVAMILMWKVFRV
ncbi:MAG TPA: LptF/LptG family permease [Planctomycetota bacterium]|nr:LptF/LptG family permease [Planctomycetota bacterium]